MEKIYIETDGDPAGDGNRRMEDFLDVQGKGKETGMEE